MARTSEGVVSEQGTEPGEKYCLDKARAVGGPRRESGSAGGGLGCPGLCA